MKTVASDDLAIFAASGKRYSSRHNFLTAVFATTTRENFMATSCPSCGYALTEKWYEDNGRCSKLGYTAETWTKPPALERTLFVFIGCGRNYNPAKFSGQYDIQSYDWVFSHSWLRCDGSCHYWALHLSLSRLPTGPKSNLRNYTGRLSAGVSSSVVLYLRKAANSIAIIETAIWRENLQSVTRNGRRSHHGRYQSFVVILRENSEGSVVRQVSSPTAISIWSFRFLLGVYHIQKEQSMSIPFGE